MRPAMIFPYSRMANDDTGYRVATPRECEVPILHYRKPATMRVRNSRRPHPAGRKTCSRSRLLPKVRICSSRWRKYSFQLSGNALTRRARCALQVAAQQPRRGCFSLSCAFHCGSRTATKVPLQHPYRGDVSPLNPMRSSAPF
jgi:hypothetical protein